MHMIPKTKYDLEAVEALKLASKDYIIKNSSNLLMWLQDPNWEIALPLANVLSKYINDIEEPILEILASDDPQWKSCIIRDLLNNSTPITSVKIVTTLRNILNNPSLGDKMEDNDQYSKDLLSKLNLPLKEH